MFPILHLGHVAIQTPGLVILIGLWLSLDLAEKNFLRYGIDPSSGYTLVAVGLVTLVVGGRLVYAAENFSAFAASPVSLVSLNITLWDLPGGLILGLTGSILYGARHKLISWSFLDSLTPTLAAMMIAIGLTDLASGNAFGAPARLPWSIFLWGEWRQPSQIYETLAAVSVLTWVLARSRGLIKKNATPLAPGRLFLEFVAWSAAWRLFLEAFRGDSALIFGQLRSAQVCAWLILAISLYLLGIRKSKAAHPLQISESSSSELPNDPARPV